MIARKSVLIITTKILDGGLGYLGLFFIARYMDPADYGIISFAMGFVTLFTIFTDLGFPSAHIKRISEGKDLGTCIGTFISIRVFLIIATLSMIFGSIYFWTNIMGRGFETTQHLNAIYIIVVFWLMNQLMQTFSKTFQAKKEIAKFQLPFILNGIVRTAAILFVALSGYGVYALAFTYVAGELAHLIFTLIFFRGYPIKKPDKSYIKNYSVFAFPMAISSASLILMKNIDKVLIQLFWNASDVGYYFAAFRLSNFITLFTSAIGLLIFPTYSKLHVEKNFSKMKKLTYDSERHLSIIVFPMVFGLIILAEPTAFIMLSGWMPAIPLLRIMPLFVLFASLSIPYSSQFNGMNKPEINRNRVVLMVVFNVLLNFLLIPKDIQMLGGIKLAGLGAEGAAIATVISFVVGFIYTRIMSYKLIGEKGNIRVLLHAFSAGLMTASLYIILYYYNFITLITRWYHLLFFSVLGLGIYLGFLILLKEFTKEDFKLYLDVLNIKKMLQYIKEELKN